MDTLSGFLDFCESSQNSEFDRLSHVLEHVSGLDLSHDSKQKIAERVSLLARRRVEQYNTLVAQCMCMSISYLPILKMANNPVCAMLKMKNNECPPVAPLTFPVNYNPLKPEALARPLNSHIRKGGVFSAKPQIEYHQPEGIAKPNNKEDVLVNFVRNLDNQNRQRRVVQRMVNNDEEAEFYKNARMMAIRNPVPELENVELREFQPIGSINNGDAEEAAMRDIIVNNMLRGQPINIPVEVYKRVNPQMRAVAEQCVKTHESQNKVEPQTTTDQKPAEKDIRVVFPPNHDENQAIIGDSQYDGDDGEYYTEEDEDTEDEESKMEHVY